MPVDSFTVLGRVIADQIDACCAVHGVGPDAVHQRILDEAERNQQQWFSNNVPDLNYDNPTCRLAYLYIVAAANAGAMFRILSTPKTSVSPSETMNSHDA